jgi:hypothetical protein
MFWITKNDFLTKSNLNADHFIKGMFLMFRNPDTNLSRRIIPNRLIVGTEINNPGSSEYRGPVMLGTVLLLSSS